MKHKAIGMKARSGKVFKQKRKTAHRAKPKALWNEKAMIHQGVLDGNSRGPNLNRDTGY